MMQHMMCGIRPDFPVTDMLNRLLTSALIAGAAAGLIAAVLQLVFVQPVLLQAELYETGARIHLFAGPDVDIGEAVGTSANGIDVVRDGLSVLFSILVYAGYGLLLVAAMALAGKQGHLVTAREGMVWGLAGFITVQLAPAFGLPPELPGMSAADIVAREIWWVATVALTAVAIWLLAFGASWPVRGAAILLLALPHIIGAPHPAELSGPTPPELAAQFAGRALGVGAAVWVLLGLFSASLWSRAYDNAA